MKHKYSLLLILIAFVFSNLALAQDDNSDAIYLKLVKEYQLNEDGSIDYHEYKQLKLLTYYAFHSLYGESFIVYNTKYQKLKINESFTTMADGKKVVTPVNAFNELLPRFAEDAPDHNYMREMAVTHTGLERNAVINLDYSIHTEKNFWPVFKVNEYIGEDSPIDELIIKISIPSGKEAKFQLINSEISPEITQENNQKTFTWKFVNVPAYLYESLQAYRTTYSPQLFFSIAKNRDEFFSSIINQPAFEYQVNEKMTRKVESMRTDASDNVDLALMIQEYVVDEFKLKHISSWDIGFRYRQADEIWESAYGTKAEKMILLTALLTAANIEATPYAVIPVNQYLDEICVPEIYDYLVRIKQDDGEDLYLSVDKTNDYNMAYELSDVVLIPFIHSAEKENVIMKQRDNEIELEADLKLNNDGLLSGLITVEAYYACNPYLDIKRNEPKAKTMLTGSISSSDINVKLVSFTPEESVIEFKVDGKKELKKKADYYFFELPLINEGIESFNIHELSAERKSPLKLQYVVDDEYEYEIELSDKLELANPEVKIEEKTAIGEVSIIIKSSSNKIKVSRSIEIYKDNISLQYYPDFRKLMNLWNDKNYRQLIIKVKQAD